jgi:hypothetical protein
MCFELTSRKQLLFIFFSVTFSFVFCFAHTSEAVVMPDYEWLNVKQVI